MILWIIKWNVVKCNESVIMSPFNIIKNWLFRWANTHHYTLLLNSHIVVMWEKFNLLEQLVSIISTQKFPHGRNSRCFFICSFLWLVIWHEICSFKKWLEPINNLIRFCITLNYCLVLVEKFLASNWLVPDLLVIFFYFLLNSLNRAYTWEFNVA
jgi:hypothetical protein